MGRQWTGAPLRNDLVMPTPSRVPDAEALRLLVESSGTALLLLSRSGRVIYANAAALGLLEIASDSAGDVSLFDLLGLPRSAAPASRIHAVLSRPGGQRTPLRVTIQPGPDGTDYLAAAVTDARQEEARAELQRDLDAAEGLESLGRLTTGISHDMKNVLQLVLGHGELLRRRMPPEPRLRTGVDQIIAAAERGARSSEAIQEYARLHQPPKQPTPLGDVVREALALLAPRLPAGGRVRLDLDGPGPVVLAEGRALRQAILHLGIRAAQAIPPDGVIEVSLATEPDHRGVSRVALTIRDNGAAVPAEVLAQVRHPFDGPPGDDASYIVGLAVADRILRDHGGALELESRPGEGTVARCLLPVSTKHT
jgi:signal transduction histidine kinase